MASQTVRLSVPAEPAFARSVRMCASTLAVNCSMNVLDVEDVRMIAEEGFVYACATAPEGVDVAFTLEPGSMAMDIALGDVDPADDQIQLVETLLDAVCDEFTFSDDGATLHLVKRTAGANSGGANE